MINLLPPDVKSSYHYARRNVRLMHWVIAFGFALLGLILISAGGIFYMHQVSQDFAHQTASAQYSLQQQKLTETEKEAKDISSSMKLVVRVLSNEVLFSKLLKRLAALTPSNAVLATLNINQAQDALDITANTTDYNAATQLQINLSDPDNGIFQKADIVSINCNGSDTNYPCAVIIRALFDTNNPFLFINKGTK